MVTVRIGTANRGDHATKRTIRKIVRRFDVTCLTEMNDQEKTRAFFRTAKRYGIIEYLDHTNAKACPIVYDRSTVELLRTFCEPLLTTKEERNIGPGVGPNFALAKWALGGRFRHIASGLVFVVVSQHNVPSQYLTERGKAAKTFTRKLDGYFRNRRVPVFIGGDWNAKQNDDSMGIFRLSSKWDFSPSKATHGDRGIDYFVYHLGGPKRSEKWAAGAAHTFKIPGSDHRGYGFALNVDER